MSWWADITSDDSTDALATEEKVTVEETNDLISFSRSTDGESRLQLSLNENVLNNLIDSCKGKPICVISAVGPCRSGKSLLLNCIKEKLSPPNHNSKTPQSPAFKVNHDYNPCTKGIRVNSEAIIVDGDQGEIAVILMDTAGLDEELLSDDKDGVLLGLPLFLSSILIYNIKGSPNEAPFELLSRLLPDANSDLGFQKLSLLFRDWVRIKEYPFGFNGGKRFLDSKRRQNKPEFMAVYNAFDQKDCSLLPHIGENHLQRKLSNVDKDTDMNDTFKRFLAQYLTELLDTSNIQAKEIYNNPLKPEDFRMYAKKYVDYYNDPTEMQLGINPESLLEITKDTTAQIILSASSAEYRTRFQQRRLDTPMKFLSNAALDRFDSLAKRTAKSVLDKYTLPSETKRELQQNFDKKIYSEFRKIKQENQAKWRQAKETVLEESCAEFRASLAAKFPFQKNALPQSAGDLMFYDDNDLNTVITNTKYVIMAKFHDEFDNEEHQDIPALQEELEEKLGEIEKEYVNRNTENRERAEKKATHLTHTCLNGYKAAMKARLDQKPNMESHFLEVYHEMELERVKKELANLNFGAGGFRKNEEQDVLRAIHAEFKEMLLNLDSRKAEAKNLVETYASDYSKEIKAAAEAMKEPELRLLHQQRMPEVIRQFQAVNPYPSSTTQNQEIKNQLEAKLQQIFINALEIIAQAIRQREGDLLKLLNNCLETIKQRLQQIQQQKDFLSEDEVGDFTESLKSAVLAEFDQASCNITDDTGKTANARSSLHDKISLEIANWVTKNKNRAAVVQSEAESILENCVKDYETQMSVQVRKINTREELQEQHETLKAASVNEFIKKSPTKNASFNDIYVQKINKKVDEMSEEIEELFNMKKNQDDVSLMAAIVDAKNSYKHSMDSKFNNVNRFFKDRELESLNDEIQETVVQAVCRQLSLSQDRKKKVIDRLHELFEKYKDKNKILKQSFEDTEIAIGIDLGTTYCCVAVFHMGRVKIILNGVGANTTPSYVTLNADGSTTVGQAAKSQSFRNPEATIFDAKRMIGRALTDEQLAEDIKLWPFKVEEVEGRAVINVHGKRYPPEKISSMLLAHLKEDAENFLGKKVTKAVITVPAYFTDGQRQATIDAGEVADLEVLAILNEPTAAAFAYRLEWFTGDAKTILVYDLGGGTFDVAILKIQENSIDVLSTAGDSHLGGEDFDQNMMKYCAQKFKESSGIDLFVGKDSENKKERDNARRRLNRLQQACEEQKKALAAARHAIVALDQIAQEEDLAVQITRDEFNRMNAQLFQRTITIVDEALRSAKITKDRIDDIVLVGGSTRIKKVQEMLEKHFQGKALNKHINPDEAVAYGAAVQAAILNGNPGAKVLDFGHVQEVTPMSLGVELANGEMDVIIPKSTKIPYSCTQTYHTFEDNQPDVSIKIYQGEAEHVIDNVLLANYTLSGIPPAAAREEAVDITMSLDKNGILNVKAICKSTNESLQVTVSDKPGGLTKDEKRLLRGRGTS